jgi:hypothetical protein
MSIFLASVIGTTPPAYCQSPSPKVVVIRNADVSDTTLAATAAARDMTLYSEFAAYRFNPSNAQASTLRSEIRRAQEAWLNGSLTTAKALFRQIAAHALEADWNPAEQETIQYAMLRLAQSADSQQEKESWLERAMAYAPQFDPPSDVFPPPLIAEFKAFHNRERARFLEVNLAEKFPAFRIIKINGRIFDVEKEPLARVSPGPLRLTGLSDANEPFSRIIDGEHIVSIDVKPLPLAGGNCETPELKSELTDSVAVLYPRDCLRIRQGEKWLSRAAGIDSLNLELSSRPRAMNSWPLAVEPKVAAQPRTWAWVALGAVVAGIIYVYNRDQTQNAETQTVVQPVHREGF